MRASGLHKLLLAMALLLAAGACGIAYAGTTLLAQIDPATLAPSADPSLLGPITVEGRTGWACIPERAATTKRWKAAALPGVDYSH